MEMIANIYIPKKVHKSNWKSVRINKTQPIFPYY